MLLIAGGESDPNTQRVVDQAHLRDMPYFFWDTDSAECTKVAWDFDSSALDLGDTRIEPSSVFLRWNVFGGDAARNQAAHSALQGYVYAWPSVRALNRGSSMDINNKSFNLRLAREIGFAIPNTLVMGHLGPLKTMPEPTRKIAKPLEGGAHTRRVSDLIAEAENLPEMSPQFVQDELGGENLRVFGVGGELFAFHLKTTALDYREDSEVDVVRIDVPSDLAAPARKLIEKKRFDYCALDFRCRLGLDEPVFLEINSFPMFVRFDDACENELVNAMLDFLQP